MATLTFSYDTGTVPLSRIIDAFAVQYGYQATINGSPNPETKAQFARHIVRQFIVDVVRDAETRTAIDAARSTVVNADLT